MAGEAKVVERSMVIAGGTVSEYFPQPTRKALRSDRSAS
tara:strand:+ start:684 stop:800 length:117 start_codon:yes stop_codon:yes gene_type:complete